MEIKGQISEIIYQNEVNSYTIAEFETDEELTTIVGYLPFINNGDSLKLVGNFVNHPDYGRQFNKEPSIYFAYYTVCSFIRFITEGLPLEIIPAFISNQC